MINQFSRFARTMSLWFAHPVAFALSVLTVLVWAAAGPFFRYSADWQLVINTGTTILTFLMVFLIQNTQNRDAKAINLKLNELIRAVHDAHDQMIDIENLSDVELDELASRYEKIRAECIAREKRKSAKSLPAA